VLVQTLEQMSLAELANATAHERVSARGQTVPAPGAVSAQRLISVTQLFVRGGHQESADLE
jgi:hypothetical protein